MHVVRGKDGTCACRYCGRAFSGPDEAEGHIRDLTRMGMLQDHIAIHWTRANW